MSRIAGIAGTKERFRSLTESKSQAGRSPWQPLLAAHGAPISHSSSLGGGSEPEGSSLFSCRITNQGQREHEGALMRNSGGLGCNADNVLSACFPIDPVVFHPHRSH